MEPIRSKARPRLAESYLRMETQAKLASTTPCTPEFLEQAIAWADRHVFVLDRINEFDTGNTFFRLAVGNIRKQIFGQSSRFLQNDNFEWILLSLLLCSLFFISQQCAGRPKYWSLAMEISGASLPRKIVGQVVLLSSAFANLCDVVILINVSNNRNPALSCGRSICCGIQPSLLYAHNHCETEHC